jgi:hypothetical protein
LNGGRYTLDALRLASLEFLRSRGQTVGLASYDERMLAAARHRNFSVCLLTASKRSLVPASFIVRGMS